MRVSTNLIEITNLLTESGIPQAKRPANHLGTHINKVPTNSNKKIYQLGKLKTNCIPKNKRVNDPLKVTY